MAKNISVAILGLEKVGMNRIKLYKAVKDLRWDFIVHHTGIIKMRLHHLANNQNDTRPEEREKLAKLFKCPPDDFLPENIIVDLRGVIGL